jgi:hypothetical protein
MASITGPQRHECCKLADISIFLELHLSAVMPTGNLLNLIFGAIPDAK